MSDRVLKIKMLISQLTVNELLELQKSLGQDWLGGGGGGVYPDDPEPNEPSEGTGGVREPRPPRRPLGSGSIALDIEHEQEHLNLEGRAQ